MKEKNPIFRSLAMIEERLQEKLTVEMLAEDIHFSKYHYQRIFREAVGETVMGYVNRRRLSLAAEELAGTKDSVLSIALKYGYDSHEGFTRSFKAYLGVTPTEYRKYHSSIGFPGKKKEESAMTNAKSADEMVRELNSLIVQAKETAAETRKGGNAEGEAAAVYVQVWEFAAGRAEEMAGRLEKVLEQVTSVTRNPDEIFARFLIVKAVEDAAFAASVTAFQTGLMISRAMPEHRAAFQPLCARYDSLAQNARMKSGKIAGFLGELWGLILEDMRTKARQKIRAAVDAGLAAAGELSEPSLPYGYIAQALRETAGELADMGLEDVTAYRLEDALFRLDTIRFAADMDILRAPRHKPLFEGILNFKEKLGEAVDFFRNLSGDAAGAFAGEKKAPSDQRTTGKIYSDLATQEEILLFYLRGEIQKLGTHLDEGQRAALDAVCGKMERAVKMARGIGGCGEGNTVAEEANGKPDSAASEEVSGGPDNDAVKEAAEKPGSTVARLLREAYDGMDEQARLLGAYGGAVRYLADEVKKPFRYLPE